MISQGHPKLSRNTSRKKKQKTSKITDQNEKKNLAKVPTHTHGFALVISKEKAIVYLNRKLCQHLGHWRNHLSRRFPDGKCLNKLTMTSNAQDLFHTVESVAMRRTSVTTLQFPLSTGWFHGSRGTEQVFSLCHTHRVGCCLVCQHYRHQDRIW